MTMKTKILIGILVFLILVNLATIGTYLYLRTTRPDGRPFPADMDRGSGSDPMAQLSAGQRERLGDLMRGFREETSTLHDQVRALEETTFSLLHREPVPSDSVDLALRRMADLRLEISRKATARLLEAKAFLSPAQQDILFEAIMKARPGMGAPMGRPGGPPGGFPPLGPGRMPPDAREGPPPGDHP
jgi:uncharacterized membrane protein